MTRPVKASDLLSLDPHLQVVKLDSYNFAETVVWQAGKADYSEVPIHTIKPPTPQECGEWIVDQLLSNERGHWGPLEHPSLTFSCAGFVHSVIVQGRTHRIGNSWDVQSQRYTGKRVLKVANGELPIEDVFYVRPEGLYTNRQGKKYEWSDEDRQRKFKRILDECEEYSEYYKKGVPEEHIRDYLPQAIRQNCVVTFNLRSILHFIDLRAKLDAQLEIQALCEAFTPYLEQWAPNVWQYYTEKRLRKARLSP